MAVSVHPWYGSAAMPPTKKKAPAAKKTAPKAADGFTASLLIRVSPDLIERIDARVTELQAERPGMSRSDFVREAVLRALRPEK
jgi:hypothetical protein